MEDGVLLRLWVLGKKPYWCRQGSISSLYWWDRESSSRGYVPFHYLLHFFCYICLTHPHAPPFFTAVRWPSLNRFYLECVQQAHLFADKGFHSLVTLRHLTIWNLGPTPTKEALAYKLITCRRKFLTFPLLFTSSKTLKFFFFIGMATMKKK